MTFDNPDFIIWPVKTTTGKKAYVLKRYKGSEAVVTIPEGVTKIDHLSFGDLVEPNEKIQKIIMPDTVTEVAKNAFGCKALTEIVFSKNIKNFDINFARCPSLKEISLPEKTEYIANLFSSKHLEKIHAGENVSSINFVSLMDKGKPDFHKDRLTEILLENTAYEIQNGILVNKAKKTALFNVDETREEIRIPDGVETIGREFLNEVYTMYNLSTEVRVPVKKVVIPKSVTRIKSLAFFKCNSLEEVIYEGASGDLTLENYSFFFCDKISGIENITCADRPKEISQRDNTSKRIWKRMGVMLVVDEALRSNTYPDVPTLKKICSDKGYKIPASTDRQIYQAFEDIVDFAGPTVYCGSWKELIKRDTSKKGYYYTQDFKLDVINSLTNS